MVRKILENRVVVGRARKVRIGQRAEHRTREIRDRNRCAGRVNHAGARIANIDRQDALLLDRCGDSRKRRQLAILTESFVVSEEERLVLHNRAAQHAAELIPPKRRLLTGCRFEIGRRIERRVAEELPPAPVQLVRAASVSDVHRRARRPTVLGALVVGDHPELTDRIRRRLHHLIREALIACPVRVVVDAVDQEIIERAAEPVHIERAFPRRPGRALVQGRLPDAGRQQRERRILAAVQRQPAGLVACDHLTALARIGFDERRRGDHLDFLADLPDGHRQIDARSRADLHLHVVDERNRETWFLGRDDVRARLDGEELVQAGRVGCFHNRKPGLGVGQGHGRVGNHRAGTVAHGADDRCGVELRQRWRGREAQEQRAQREQSSHRNPFRFEGWVVGTKYLPDVTPRQ